MAASSARGLRVIKAIQEYVKACPNQFDTSSILAKETEEIVVRCVHPLLILTINAQQKYLPSATYHGPIRDIISHCPKHPESPGWALAVKFIDISDKRAKAKLTVEPQMCNLLKTMHGGYMVSVMDAVLVVHLMSCTDGKLAWTTNLNVHFLSPAAVGEQVTLETSPVKISSSSILMEAKATNDSTGLIVAKGSMSFMYGHDKLQKVGQDVLKLDFSRND